MATHGRRSAARRFSSDMEKNAAWIRLRSDAMRSIAVSTGSARRAAATSASVRPCHFRFSSAVTRRISTFSASVTRLQRSEEDSSARIAARTPGSPSRS